MAHWYVGFDFPCRFLCGQSGQTLLRSVSMVLRRGEVTVVAAREELKA